MINKIKLSLKNKLELRLAEVFWLLPNDGTATSQQIANKLGFPVEHIQAYLSVLEGLGTATQNSTNNFSISSPQRAKQLHWLLQYQAVCQQDDSCYIPNAPVLFDDKYQWLNQLCRNGKKGQKSRSEPILIGQSLDFLIEKNF